MTASVPYEDLRTADLRRDSIYLAGTSGTIRDEPLHRLTGVGNQGGIRPIGSEDSPRLVVLFSTRTHDDWPDTVDQSGLVRYHGDSRKPGELLGPRGNRVLRHVFARGFATRADRAAAPPFLVFTSVTEPGVPGRSVRFEGLAVPGTDEVPAEDWLVAKWFDGTAGRYENYVLTAMLLDVDAVPRTWIDDVGRGGVLGSSCPLPYREWVESGRRRAVGSTSSG